MWTLWATLKIIELFLYRKLVFTLEYRQVSLCLSLLHLLFRYSPLSGLWTSAACGTSSDLIASVCSFCSSVQTLQSGLLQSQLHSWRPCHLLGFRKRPQRIRDFHPLEHSISRAIFTIQGTHKR